MTNTDQADALTQLVKWIPTSERLPKHGQTVQIAWKHYEDNPITLGYWNEIQKSWYSGYVTASRDVATHWAERLKRPSELKTTRAPEPEGERLPSAARITAEKVHDYLTRCSSRERWPERDEIERIFRDFFAPLCPLKAAPTAQPEAEQAEDYANACPSCGYGLRVVDEKLLACSKCNGVLCVHCDCGTESPLCERCAERATPTESQPTAGSGEGEAVSDLLPHEQCAEALLSSGIPMVATIKTLDAVAAFVLPFFQAATCATEQAKAQAEQERDYCKASETGARDEMALERDRHKLTRLERNSLVAELKTVLDCNRRYQQERDQAEQRARAAASAIRAKLSELPYSLRRVESELDQLTQEGKP